MEADAAVADAVVAVLVDLADPARAEGEARYLKSTRAHLGVRVPEVRRAVRSVTAEHGIRTREDVLATATVLWSTRPAGQPGEVHECCLAAVELLVAHARVLDVADLALVEDLVRRSGTWALVDPLAEKAAGDVAGREPPAAVVLDRWAADPDFWLRRSALLALLPPLKAGGGDWDRFVRYADSMLDEKEFFVRKAIGWVLRETGKRRPALVAGWLAERGDRVPGLVRREASKYLG